MNSTLLSVLHPRQVGQLAGFAGAAWVRWGTFSVYGAKLHLLCATNEVPISQSRLLKELFGEGELHDVVKGMSS